MGTDGVGDGRPGRRAGGDGAAGTPRQGSRGGQLGPRRRPPGPPPSSSPVPHPHPHPRPRRSTSPVVIQRTGPNQSSSTTMWRRSQKTSTRRRLPRSRRSCQTEVSEPDRAVGERETCGDDVLDAVDGRGSSLIGPTTDGDRAEQPLEHVEVVDRVLEQRARAGLGRVGPPGRRRTGPGSGCTGRRGTRPPSPGRLGSSARWPQRTRTPASGAAPGPTWLTTPARRHGVDHRRRPSRGRRRAASRRTPARPRSATASTRRGCSDGPGADVHRVEPVEHLVLGARPACSARARERRPAWPGRGRTPRRSRRRRPRCEHLAVVVGDEPAAEEPDPDRHRAGAGPQMWPGPRACCTSSSSAILVRARSRASVVIIGTSSGTASASRTSSSEWLLLAVEAG